MSKPEHTADETSETDGIEQRLAALEEENQRIRDQLEAQQQSGWSDTTRRGALGVLGGGALLGLAGSAGAQSSGSGNSMGGPNASYTAQTFHDVPAVQSESDGVVDRDMVSARPTQIYVDPNGNDDADGTKDDPVASVQEALNRLPYILAHPHEIILASGTADNPTVHDSENGFSAMHLSVFSSAQDPDEYFDNGSSTNIVIRSESGNTEDTVLHADYYLSLCFVGNSVLNVALKNLTVDGGLENYGGSLGCIDCVLKGSPRTGQQFAGYSGNTFATRCEITAPVVTTDSGGAIVGLNSCTVNAPEGETDWNGDRGVLSKYQSGATVFAKGGDINLPWFGDGAIGIVITQEDIYHPAAPDGILGNSNNGNGGGNNGNGGGNNGNGGGNNGDHGHHGHDRSEHHGDG